MKFFQEIRTETRISNINLKKTEKTRLALKFSQEIRTETRISNFKLKEVRNIYVWGGGDIWGGGGYLGEYVPHYIFEGGCVPHYIPENLNLVGIFGGDLFRIIYLKGDMFPMGDFIQVNGFFILFT